MRSIALTVTLVSLAAFAGAQAVAPAPETFTLRPTASRFTWSATTNQGPITTGQAAFAVGGELQLEVSMDAAGIHAARFLRSDAFVRPDLSGTFSGQQGTGFAVSHPRLSFSSDAFPVNHDGTFTTTLNVRFTNGRLQVAPPLGPGWLMVLDGQSLRAVVVSGTLRQDGAILRLDVPIVLDYDFGFGAVSGTVHMPGALVAGMRL